MIQYSVNLMGSPNDPSKPKKAYARAQMANNYTLKQLCAHVERHNNKYDRGDIYAVIVHTVRCVIELVQEGNKVSIGDLGAFYPSITSNGADTIDAFTEDNITGLTIKWDRPSSMDNIIEDAHFQKVLTRKQQAAALALAASGKLNDALGIKDNDTESVSSDENSDSAVTPGTGDTPGSNPGGTSSGTGSGSSSSSGDYGEDPNA